MSQRIIINPGHFVHYPIIFLYFYDFVDDVILETTEANSIKSYIQGGQIDILALSLKYQIFHKIHASNNISVIFESEYLQTLQQGFRSSLDPDPIFKRPGFDLRDLQNLYEL